MLSIRGARGSTEEGREGLRGSRARGPARDQRRYLGCRTTSQILARTPDRRKVSCVVIESTSDYWKPFYYLLDDGLNVVLVNAASVTCPAARPIAPDAAWLADLGAHGLVKAPLRATGPDPGAAGPDPGPHGDHPRTHPRGPTTREATRRRRHQTVLGGLRDHRLRAMPKYIAGQRDPAALADLAQRRMRSKIPALTEALTGWLGEYSCSWPGCS